MNPIPAQQSPADLERHISDLESGAVSVLDVAERVAFMSSPRKRGLLFFVQALASKIGGMRALARLLFETYPEHVGTPTMHQIGVRPGRKYSEATARQIQREIDGRWLPMTAQDQESEEARLSLGEMFGSSTKERDPDADALDPEHWRSRCRAKVGELADILTRLCADPRIEFSLTGRGEAEEDRAAWLRHYPRLEAYLTPFQCPFFSDLVGTLLDLQARHAKLVVNGFAMTEVSRKVWDALDTALRTGKLVLLEGHSGLGKSFAAERWCEAHLGQACLVRLNGIPNKTSFFRAIALAIGIRVAPTTRAMALQARVEDFLAKSRIMVVLDEAHFAVSQSAINRSQPVLIDWIDTALFNAGVPAALIATPQFTEYQVAIEAKTMWNGEQFRRRLKRQPDLPAELSEEDLRAVARKIIPESDARRVNYAVSVGLDGSLSDMVELLDDAQELAGRDGRAAFTVADMEQTRKQALVPLRAARLRVLDRIDRLRGRQRRRLAPVAVPLEAAGADPAGCRPAVVPDFAERVSAPLASAAIAGRRMTSHPTVSEPLVPALAG